MVSGLVVVIPLVVLTLSSTNNIIYPRFALFALPFGFLLAAHGLVAPLARAAAGRHGPGVEPGRRRGPGRSWPGRCCCRSPWGCSAYYTPDGNTALDLPA